MQKSLTVKNALLLLGLLVSSIALMIFVVWSFHEPGWKPIVGAFSALATLLLAIHKVEWGDLIVNTEDHDRVIFCKSDAVLNELLVLKIVDDVCGPHFRRANELELCDTFHLFFAQDGNQYLDKRLQQYSLAFNNALNELGAYTGHNFSMIGQHLFQLKPKLLQKIDVGDAEAERKYQQYIAELQQLATNVSGAYSLYRNEVRTKLKL